MRKATMNTTLSKSSIEHPTVHQRRSELARVEQCIRALCDSLEPGAKIPSHHELMQRFGASERTVLRSLEDLQRGGRIVRRTGSGTYVADHAAPGNSVRYSSERNRTEVATSARVRSAGCTSIVVVASHDNSYLSRGIELIYDSASEYNMMVSYEPPREERIEALCASGPREGRGFLVLGSNRYELCKRIHESGNRVVMVGSPSHETDMPFPCVNIDNFRGGYIAAEHLVSLGHRHIAIVEPTSAPRYWGYDAALRDAAAKGFVIQRSQISEETFAQWQRNIQLPAEYFASPNRPTALWTWNDHDAITLLTLLQSIAIRVPDQVSIIGYDNGREATSVTPALTTIDTRLKDRIKIALDLLARPASSAPQYTALILPQLIERASATERIG